MQVYKYIKGFFNKISATVLEIAFSLLPETNGLRDLGSSAKKWGNVYGVNFHGSGANLTDLPGGIADVVEDLTPQLGGDLDTTGKKVTSTAWTELDGTSGVRLRAGGSMKINIGAVGVQPMANIIPNVGASYDLGISGYGFKEVHANSFHGSGANLTDLPENDLLKYVVVKGKMIFPATASNIVYDDHYKQGLDDHATADLGNIQNYQRDLIDYSTFASGKTAVEMVSIKGQYEVVGWEYQISSKTADNSNPDLSFYPMIYTNTGAMQTFGGITLNNKYVDNAYVTSGTIINMGHMWVSPYAKRRTGSVAIQETLINYEIRYKLAKVV